MALPLHRHLRLGCRDAPLSRRSPLAKAALALAIAGAFAVLLALGTWQVQRLHWKEALIAAAAERPTAPPVAAPGPAAWDAFALDEWNYRRVTLNGRFGNPQAYQWTMLTEPNGPRGGEGAFVVAPFTTADGWSVIVNRGFVPKAARESGEAARWAPPARDVSIEGLIRRDDPPNWFTPAPATETGTVHTRHIATLAAMFGLDPALTAPYSVDLIAAETPPGGLPQAGESRIAFTNNHLQYAITWYGLALALLAVAGAAWWRGRKRRESLTAS